MTVEGRSLERAIELQAVSFVTTAPDSLVARTVPRRDGNAEVSGAKSILLNGRILLSTPPQRERG